MGDLAAFDAAAAGMADAVRRLPPGTRWFVDCDADADGLCGAAVAMLALRRIGHRVHIRPSRDKDTGHYERVLDQGGAQAWMFIDKGSSHAPLLAASAKPCFIVDHHSVPDGARPALLNPRACGLDGGRDASASTTAAALAWALVGHEAAAWAPHALAGAWADRQAVEGWHGWNAELARRALEAGTLTEALLPALEGPDLAEAVASWQGMPALAGMADPVAWLGRLGLDPAADVAGLDAEGRTRIVSAMALALLAAGRPHDVQKAVTTATIHAAFMQPLAHVQQLVDACGRLGHGATGIAALVGDAGARRDAQALHAAYRARLRDALRDARATPPVVVGMVAWVRLQEPALGGLVAAALAASPRQAPETGVVLVSSPRPDGAAQVSARARRGGVDLAHALSGAALEAGGSGGGHPQAAGAVVPQDGLEAFVAAVANRLEAAA